MLKNLLYFAIFSTFLVLVVIGLNIYHNFTTSTVSSDASIQIIPITPSFDVKTIKMLKSRTGIPVNLQEQVSFPTGVPALPNAGATKPNPSPTIEVIKQGSPSATPGFFPPGL